jgi:hypothetical protein
MANTTPKLKVTKPNSFNGSPAHFHDWKQQLLIYICTHHIIEDNDKILLALSYMKSSTTNAWATRYFDKHMVEPWLGQWQDFLNKLCSSFEDKNLQRKAREKMETFRQGTWP